MAVNLFYFRQYCKRGLKKKERLNYLLVNRNRIMTKSMTVHAARDDMMMPVDLLNISSSLLLPP